MIQFLSYSEVIVSEKCSAKQIRMITYLPTSGKYNTTAPSKIKPYGEDIKRLLSEGVVDLINYQNTDLLACL